MPRTESGATFVLAMKRRRDQNGQALIEYAFLLVLLATITFAVVALAGDQLRGMFDEVSYEITHIADATTVAPDGTTLGVGATPMPGSCAPGQTLELRGHKWKCR
jgi:Flp pilus assembly pilin Flp